MMLSSGGKKPIVSINLTPLVDVSLVLVVIFMATAPMFLQSGIAVYPGEKKSEADAAAGGSTDDTIMLKLAPNGIWLNDKKIAEAEITQQLTRMLLASQKKRVVILPGDEIMHGEVIRMLDLSKQCGAKKLVIMGNTPAAK
jgi:biopolymer transport protein ExbD